ncbi:MAG: hypothetical protein Q9195_006878 [Heterodermia aff. obscurata]
MPAEGHGKGYYSQGLGERGLHVSREPCEGTANRPKAIMFSNSSDRGSLTYHDDGIALQPLRQRLVRNYEKVSNSAAPPPPVRGCSGLNEESLQSPQLTTTYPEHLQEDPSQNQRRAFLVSNSWPAKESEMQNDTIFAMFEAAVEVLYKSVENGLPSRRCWRSAPFKTMLKQLDIMRETFPPTTEMLEFRRLILNLRSEDQGYNSSRLVLSTIEGLDNYIPIDELDYYVPTKPRTTIPIIIEQRVMRNLKYWRQAQLLPLQKQDSANANLFGRRILTESQPQVTDFPTICHRLIMDWKTRAGKNKDWSRSPIRDLLKNDKLRGRGIHKRRCVPSQVVNWLSHNTLQTSVLTAVRLHEIPRDMLRSYRDNSAQSGLSALLHLERATKRMLKSESHKKKSLYLDLARKSKRDRASDIKELVSEEISFLRVGDHNDSADVDTVPGIDEWSPSNSVPPSKFSAKGAIYSESNKSAADALCIPYESRIGAIVGGRFVLRGLITTKPCYDVHAATDVRSDVVYTAKAYGIRGTKGNERKYRLANLKRNASKASCIASVDQGGRKWLFFSDVIEQVVEAGSLNDVFAWYGKEQYQHHFPVLSERCTIAYTPPGKPYASCIRAAVSESKETNCVQEVSLPSEDRSAKRKEKVRDRQRNKRKQKRAAEAIARKATDVEAALPEQINTSVNMSRPASKSKMNSELETLSIASSSDSAEFERFLGSLDENISDRQYPEVDERFWKLLLDGPAETFKRRCLDVFAGYRTMVQVGAQTDAVNFRMVQNIQRYIGSWETEEAIRFIVTVRASLGKMRTERGVREKMQKIGVQREREYREEYIRRFREIHEGAYSRGSEGYNRKRQPSG